MSANQKKFKKYGRNSADCAAYKSEHRHEKSHIRRIKVHLLRYRFDTVAKVALINLATQVSLNAVNSATEFLKTVRNSTAKRIRPRYRGVAMGGMERAQ